MTGTLLRELGPPCKARFFDAVTEPRIENGLHVMGFNSSTNPMIHEAAHEKSSEPSKNRSTCRWKVQIEKRRVLLSTNRAADIVTDRLNSRIVGIFNCNRRNSIATNSGWFFFLNMLIFAIEWHKFTMVNTKYNRLCSTPSVELTFTYTVHKLNAEQKANGRNRSIIKTVSKIKPSIIRSVAVHQSW